MAHGAAVTRGSGRRPRTWRSRKGGYQIRWHLRGIHEVCATQPRRVRDGFPHNRPRAVASLRDIKRGSLLWR